MNPKMVNLVAKNPEGSLTAVMVNGDEDEKTCRFVIGDEVTEIVVPSQGVATVHWEI